MVSTTPRKRHPTSRARTEALVAYQVVVKVQLYQRAHGARTECHGERGRAPVAYQVALELELDQVLQRRVAARLLVTHRTSECLDALVPDAIVAEHEHLWPCGASTAVSASRRSARRQAQQGG